MIAQNRASRSRSTPSDQVQPGEERVAHSACCLRQRTLDGGEIAARRLVPGRQRARRAPLAHRRSSGTVGQVAEEAPATARRCSATGSRSRHPRSALRPARPVRHTGAADAEIFGNLHGRIAEGATGERPAVVRGEAEIGNRDVPGTASCGTRPWKGDPRRPAARRDARPRATGPSPTTCSSRPVAAGAPPRRRSPAAGRGSRRAGRHRGARMRHRPGPARRAPRPGRSAGSISRSTPRPTTLMRPRSGRPRPGRCRLELLGLGDHQARRGAGSARPSTARPARAPLQRGPHRRAGAGWGRRSRPPRPSMPWRSATSDSQPESSQLFSRMTS